MTLLAVGLLSVFVFSGAAFASGWEIEFVDNAGPGGSTGFAVYNSLDFDAGDLPHISYYDHTSKDLKYATRDAGGNWTVEYVDAVGKVGKDTSVDASGAVSISYYDESNGDLKFAQRVGGAWTITVVDNGGGSSYKWNDTGEYTSLEIDDGGIAHIAYYNDSSGDLRYAVQVGSGGNCGSGAWQCTTVDGTDDVGQYASLALGTDGKPHIGYYNFSSKDLKYAVYAGSGGNCGGGAWSCQTVDSAGQVGRYASIGIGSDGYPKIAYEYESGADLRFACLSAAGWAIQDVETAGDTGKYASLAIGSDGLPRIAYHKEGEESLKFALRVEVCGLPGSWVTMLVDNNGDVGDHNSIALKSDNSPCISYNDHTNASLKYACWNSTPPILALTCPTGDHARWASYYDYTVRSLSVDYRLTNGGGEGAYNLMIVGSQSTNGVTTGTPLPYLASPSLPVGDDVLVTMKHTVPMGVYGFLNTTYATAEDSSGTVFNYPCQNPSS